jgi:hypothetical protein
VPKLVIFTRFSLDWRGWDEVLNIEIAQRFSGVSGGDCG